MIVSNKKKYCSYSLSFLFLFFHLSLSIKNNFYGISHVQVMLLCCFVSLCCFSFVFRPKYLDNPPGDCSVAHTAPMG